MSVVEISATELLMYLLLLGVAWPVAVLLWAEWLPWMRWRMSGPETPEGWRREYPCHWQPYGPAVVGEWYLPRLAQIHVQTLAAVKAIRRSGRYASLAAGIKGKACHLGAFTEMGVAQCVMEGQRAAKALLKECTVSPERWVTLYPEDSQASVYRGERR